MVTSTVAVEISAIGMASSLGGLVTGCAAQRAGLRRAADALDYEVQPQDELARVPARVCALPSATFGFTGVGRLTAILYEVFLDLAAQQDLATVPAPAELFVALPDPVDLGIPVSERLEDDLGGRVAALGTRVLANIAPTVAARLGPGAGLDAPATFFAGRVGFAHAMAAAREAIEQQRAATCAVIAVDSLVDPPVLDALVLEQRLKTDDNPVGLVPGEGGAVFWLQAAGRSGAGGGPRRGRDGRPVLAAPAFREGPRRTRPGRDLAACITDVTRAAASGKGPETAPLLISDYNGEPDMAEEWGATLAYLRAAGSTWIAPANLFPAVGFGDCGAASAALGLCVAARAFARGYAPSPATVVVSSGDTARAALLLGAPTP